MEELNFDGECTCEEIDWEADEDGFEGCPFCQMWQEDEFVDDADDIIAVE